MYERRVIRIFLHIAVDHLRDSTLKTHYQLGILSGGRSKSYAYLIFAIGRTLENNVRISNSTGRFVVVAEDVCVPVPIEPGKDRSKCP